MYHEVYLRFTVIFFQPVALPRKFVALQLYVPFVVEVATDITRTRCAELFCISAPFRFHSNFSGAGLPSALQISVKVSPAITVALGSAIITAREGGSVKE